ncbi:HTH_Tnp_Tc3_2 domain-containing protein [Trichonephila clavipes]|nr:HTH_Tnp_Tc3_2 domain-containing protein [Trichonephila clavipes]
MNFRFSRTTISRVYHEYQESGKTSNLRLRCGLKKNTQERDQRRLTRIIKRGRRATLPQIAADFNANHSTKHHPYGLSEPKAYSYILVDCTKERSTLHLWARHSTVDDWKQVAWSDKSRFQLNRVDGRVESPEFPDISIIEYIWDALQRAVQKRSPPLLTPTDVRTALQNSWYELPPALLQTLIKSPPRHVAALLRARGGTTQY